MKRVMELNGVANMSLLLQLETDVRDNKVEMNIETLVTLKEQLILLERYMLAYNAAVTKGEQTPYWHEVLANPDKYPTNRERFR